MQGASPLASPDWAGRGTGSTSVSGTPWGACPLCRLPILPLAYLSAPIPPPPLPLRGRGRFLAFLCKGLRPLHPRSWTGRGTGSVSVGGTPWEACLFGRWFALPPRYPTGGMPSLSPAYPAFNLLSRPHPPTPLPLRGRGRFLVFFYARGFAPCIPGGWTGRGTGSTSVSGARRGACLFGRRLALPLWYPAEANKASP